MKRTCVAAFIWITLTSIAIAPVRAASSPIGRALSELTERLDQSPRDAGLLNDYGNLLVHAGFMEEAEMAYRSALEVAPESLSARYNLGLLELELGHPREARKQFRRAIKIDSSFGRAHYGLGSTYVAFDRNRRAVKQYSRAFMLDSGLLEVESNPEMLFNKLTTWASIHGYLTASPGRAGRVYEDPRPIVGLLIPGMDELLDQTTSRHGEEPAAETEEEGETAEQREGS